ncbi:hypothetical protein F25303_10634 [Fusarium sp. NRRL 25303]|nr:hypothetical protein F25303_10634 [Fusarium sp. NRRL 25303]
MVSKWFALQLGWKAQWFANLKQLILWWFTRNPYAVQNVGSACDSSVFIKMLVEEVNKTAAFIISSLKTRSVVRRQFQVHHQDYPFIMSNPHYIKVPRGEDPSPNTEQEHISSSEQMKNWLQEGHKDTPWHGIDVVVASNTQDNSDVNVAPSDTPATQGSNK